MMRRSVVLPEPDGPSSASSEPLLTSTLTFVAYPTTQFFDGRHADISWLQEVPDPVTKMVWGNCAEIHPETAARLDPKAAGACAEASYSWMKLGRAAEALEQIRRATELLRAVGARSDCRRLRVGGLPFRL